MVRERHAARGLRLRALVLVVREHQVGAAAMDVEWQAQVLLRHARALDVPARPAVAPGRFPRGLARLGRLPQREVERVALAVLDALGAQIAMAGFHLVDVAARKRAVRRERTHAEVHVAVVGRVGMSRVDELLHERDHRVDFARRARAHRGVEHVHGVHVGDEGLGVLGCDFGGAAPLFVGLVDDLVVDVGHVLHEDHVETAPRQVAADDVEADERAGVADMDVVVHRGTAHVHLHLAVLERHEVDLLVHLRVEYLYHASSHSSVS